MKKYLKLWKTEKEHEDYIDSTAFTYHYVSLVKDDYNVHYDPKEPSTSYTFSNMEYDNVVPASATSNDISWDYTQVEYARSGRETGRTTGSDNYTATFDENITDSAKTINGEIVRYDTTAEYEFTQEGAQLLTANFNVTDTSSPTRILSSTTNVSAVCIDDVKQPSVTTGYTFSATGEHTVKYTLRDVTSISNSAFTKCTSLTSITIPDSVTSISSYAFRDCSGLTSINIPSGVTSIGVGAFQNCSKLMSIVVDSSNVVYDSRNNCNAIIETNTNKLIRGCNNTLIPSDVTSIESSAFSQCTGLTSIYIPDSVTSIGNGVFYGCSNLISVNIPSGVTSVGSGAFEGCTSLPVENNIRYADTYAVSTTNKKLSSYTLKDGTRFIGDNAFSGCTNMASIVIPNSVTSIYTQAFYKCRSLTSCTIGSGVTMIGSYAFRECTSLTSIVIPDSVTSINNGAFYGCSSITSCTIGSGVTFIGPNIFTFCTSLTSIESNATTAPTIDSYASQGIATGGTLYVPIGSSGYDTWMSTSSFYLGYYNWTKVEQ